MKRLFDEDEQHNAEARLDRALGHMLFIVLALAVVGGWLLSR